MRTKFGLPATWALIVAVIGLSVIIASPAVRGLPVEIQLAIILDGSSSISASDFLLEKDGVAKAIRAVVPTDGTVELSVIQLGVGANGDSRPEIHARVIDSPATLEQFAKDVEKIHQALGRTNFAAAIKLAMSEITRSPNFAVARRHAINIASDGNPNRPVGEKTGRQRALQAVSDAVAAGLNEFDAEGLGKAASDPNSDFLKFLLELAFPQPSVLISDPSNPQDTGGKGFVVRVQTFQAVETAFKVKLQSVLIPASANAGGPYVCQPGQKITLDGSKSKPSNQGTITSFAWDFNGDGIFGDATGVKPTFTCPSASTTVTLKIMDSRGKSSTATADVIITIPPKANADGPYQCKEKRTITLNGSASHDPDGQIVKFEWDFNGDGLFDDATGPTPSFTCPATDTLTTVKVALRVTDNSGATDKATALVEVQPNVAPIADAGPNPDGKPNDPAYTCDPGQTIQLNGSGSRDPDGQIVKFEWEFKGGNEFKDATGPIVNFVCPNVSGLALDDLIKLRVTDDDGAQTVDAATLVVTQTCPATGKLNDFLSTLKGLSSDYLSFFVELHNHLADAQNALDSLGVDPADDDLSGVKDELNRIFPVTDAVADLFRVVTTLSADQQCRVKAFKKNLQDRMSAGKLADKFGKRIIRDLDALASAIKHVDESVPTVVGEVDAADAALAKAIVAADDQEPEGVIDGVNEALKQLTRGMNDISRIEVKFIREILNRLKSIERVLDVASRHGGLSAPGIVHFTAHLLSESGALGRGPVTFVAEGADAVKIQVQVFALSGAVVASPSSAGNRLVYTGLSTSGQTLANGVYLYIVTATDAQGQLFRSEVSKLIVAR